MDEHELCEAFERLMRENRVTQVNCNHLGATIRSDDIETGATLSEAFAAMRARRLLEQATTGFDCGENVIVTRSDGSESEAVFIRAANALGPMLEVVDKAGTRLLVRPDYVRKA